MEVTGGRKDMLAKALSDGRTSEFIVQVQVKVEVVVG